MPRDEAPHAVALVRRTRELLEVVREDECLQLGVHRVAPLLAGSRIEGGRRPHAAVSAPARLLLGEHDALGNGLKPVQG